METPSRLISKHRNLVAGAVNVAARFFSIDIDKVENLDSGLRQNEE